MHNSVHELMHYKSGGLASTLVSSHPDFAVSIEDGQVLPVGDAAKEIFKLMEEYPGFSELLKYPIQAVGKLNLLSTPEQVQEELLVQMASAWVHDPKLRIVIAHDAPVLAQCLADSLGKGAYVNEFARNTTEGVLRDSNGEENELEGERGLASEENGNGAGSNSKFGRGRKKNSQPTAGSVPPTDGDDPGDGGPRSSVGRRAIQELELGGT